MNMESWRTVHALQLERGVSSVVVASNGERYREQLDQVRQGSDEAVKASEAASFYDALKAEREAVDQALRGAPANVERSGEVFYSVFNAFSDLIKHTMGTAMARQRHSAVVKTFARLKEELAKERGFVASVLALPELALGSLPARAFGDFVVCRHSQHAHVACLRDLVHMEGEELDLVNAGINPPPVLEEVRTRLLRTFDVAGVRACTSLDEWWELMNTFVDHMLAVQRRLIVLTLDGASGSSIGSDDMGDEKHAYDLVKSAASAIAAPIPSSTQQRPRPQGGHEGTVRGPFPVVSSGPDESTGGEEGGDESGGSPNTRRGGSATDLAAAGQTKEGAAKDAAPAVAAPAVAAPAAGLGGGSALAPVAVGGGGGTVAITSALAGVAGVSPSESSVPREMLLLASSLAAQPAELLKRQLLRLVQRTAKRRAKREREALQTQQQQRQQEEAEQQEEQRLLQQQQQQDGTAANGAAGAAAAAAAPSASSGVAGDGAAAGAGGSAVAGASGAGGAASGAARRSSAADLWCDRETAELAQRPDICIPLSELAFVRQIGHGASARCYEARWAGDASSVAVKVASAGTVSLWKAEVAHLERLRHPNIISMLGVVVAPPTFCLVLEYCPGGDLCEACHRPTPPGFFLRVARGVASGMSYLHRKGILHRDLKSANILLDATYQPKLIDFGTATDGVTNQPQRRGALTAETGTYRWMAPEVILHEAYSKPADVFSFGMVLYELLTREWPFANRPAISAAMAVAIEHLRPTLPVDTPPAIAALTRQCWAAQPELRHTFAQLTILLERIDNELSPEQRLWLDEPYGHSVSAPPSTSAPVGGGGDPPAAYPAAVHQGLAMRAGALGGGGQCTYPLAVACDASAALAAGTSAPLPSSAAPPPVATNRAPKAKRPRET